MQTLAPGFSLLELMIVISIISILTMFALPSYQQYTKRARFAEVIQSTLPYKTAVAIALQSGTPINELVNGAHWIPEDLTPTKNLAKITVKKGIITATGTSLTNHATYILSPNEDGTRFTLDGTCLEMGLCRD